MIIKAQIRVCIYIYVCTTSEYIHMMIIQAYPLLMDKSGISTGSIMYGPGKAGLSSSCSLNRAFSKSMGDVSYIYMIHVDSA